MSRPFIEGRRIVSLLSSNTEMACALGLAGNLAGISHECDYPPEILHLPRVTSTRIRGHATSREIDRQVMSEIVAGRALYDIDEALLRALNPGLILTQAQCEVCAVDLDDVRAAVARFPQGQRPEVLSFQPVCLEDVLEDMERLAAAAGVEALGRKVIGGLRDRIRRVASACGAGGRREKTPRVLTLEWMDPPMPGGCWTPQLVEMAGGLPVLIQAGKKTRACGWDEIEATRAEVVIIMPCGFGIGQTLRDLPEFLDRPEVRPLPAVGEGRVFVADGNALFNRPGPRLVDSLELLAHLIQPGIAREEGIPFPAETVVSAFKQLPLGAAACV